MNEDKGLVNQTEGTTDTTAGAARLESSSKINPAHYRGDEVMKIIERFDLGFSLGNSVKYILRAGKKEGESEMDDLQKALWYLERRLLQLRTQK